MVKKLEKEKKKILYFLFVFGAVLLLLLLLLLSDPLAPARRPQKYKILDLSTELIR